MTIIISSKVCSVLCSEQRKNNMTRLSVVRFTRVRSFDRLMQANNINDSRIIESQRSPPPSLFLRSVTIKRGVPATRQLTTRTVALSGHFFIISKGPRVRGSKVTDTRSSETPSRQSGAPSSPPGLKSNIISCLYICSHFSSKSELHRKCLPREKPRTKDIFFLSVPAFLRESDEDIFLCFHDFRVERIHFRFRATRRNGLLSWPQRKSRRRRGARDSFQYVRACLGKKSLSREEKFLAEGHVTFSWKSGGQGGMQLLTFTGQVKKNTMSSCWQFFSFAVMFRFDAK